MTKQLTLDEMLECAQLAGIPEASDWRTQMETLGSAMAASIGSRLGVIAGEATSEGTAFGGTCASFTPAYDGQECPDELAQFDPSGEWAPKDTTETQDQIEEATA